MSTQEVAKSPKVAKVAKKTPAKKIPSTHPKFNEMIKAGIEHLKERTGSSRIALLKYIVSTYKLDEKAANVHLKMALKRGVKDGSLKQVKGIGSNGSFKLADGVKKSSEGKKKVVKTTVAKPAVKKVVAKKVVTKKAAPEDKPKKNVKKVVKPKAPKPVAEKPAEPAKPVSEKPKATKTVKAVKKPAVKPAAKTDVKKATKTASKQKAKKN